MQDNQHGGEHVWLEVMLKVRRWRVDRLNGRA
jgi:hypothetical protein